MKYRTITSGMALAAFLTSTMFAQTVPAETNYVVHENKILHGPIIKIIEDVKSVGECAQKCDEHTGAPCNSFTYIPGAQCELKSEHSFQPQLYSGYISGIRKSFTHRLKVLYVIPKGQSARPRADEAIAAIMAILQKHYLMQLGSTFALEAPLVTRAEILQDAAYAQQWQNHIRLIRERLPEDYVYMKHVIFSIIEGSVDHEGPGGSWNTVKMTSGFWNDAYNTFVSNPDLLPMKLHGWSHELGHAFGLLHSDDMKRCMAESKIAIGPSPSTIMQKTTELGSVYNYPFLDEEKKMLLVPSYYPGCRPLLDERDQPQRPHASNHLKLRSLEVDSRRMIVSGTNNKLAINAWNGAAHGTILRLHEGCSVNNPDCTWTYRDGMLISDKNPRLAIHASGGAVHGAYLKLNESCRPDNPDCTWTLRDGVFYSNRDPRLAINGWGGSRYGTELRLHNGCRPDNGDCVWLKK